MIAQLQALRITEIEMSRGAFMTFKQSACVEIRPIATPR
jgi:hypothetical protein